MSTGIMISAHSQLAGALRHCILHVFPESAQSVVAFDVDSAAPLETTLSGARSALARLAERQALVLTDVFGATPCNVAQKIVDGAASRLVVGVNLPMLLRALTYRSEPLDQLVERAIEGGMQGVMQVATIASQEQGNEKT